MLQQSQYLTDPETTSDDDVRKVLAENAFINPDVGDINAAQNTDYWIISLPKCATTSIQRGLERTGRRVIHIHTNSSLHGAYPNGNVLQDAGIGVEDLVRARLASSGKKVHCFFGYREPLSWWVSLAGQFSLDYASLAEDADGLSRHGHPWDKYAIEDMAEIVYKGFGVDISGQPFDSDRGVSVREYGNFNLILYRFDRMDAVEDYIRTEIDDRFVMEHDRVNIDENYLTFKTTFKPSSDALRKLYDDPWCRYFYAPAEIEKLLSEI